MSPREDRDKHKCVTKLYVLEQGRRIEVFDDPVADALVLGRRLSSWQAYAASNAGLELERVTSLDGLAPPYFVMDEDVHVTTRYLTDFVAAAERAGKNAIAGIASNPVIDDVANAHPRAQRVPGGVTYALRYVTNDDAPTPILLAMDDLQYSATRLPAAIQTNNPVYFCESTRAILQIGSPLHVYQANMHQNLERASGLLDGSNDIGKNCDIHPTAYLEGCTVGDGATIGAHAVLRWSDIGERAHVYDSVNMLRGVIGEGTTVHLQHRVVHAVTYPECFIISGALQFSIMGRASAIFAAWITDARMDEKSVRTVVDGQVVDSGMRFLGALVGHGAKVTAGVVTAPGRVVPSGATIHPSGQDVYTGWPAGADVNTPFFLG